MAKQAAGTDKAKNTVVLGLVAGWFGIAREAMLRGIEKRFSKKGAALVQANERAFALGEQFAKDNPLTTPHVMGRPEERTGQQVTDGRQQHVRRGRHFRGM